MNKKLILFICTGNICRSPMAEYILRDKLKDDDKWKMGSAGVFACLGSPASQYGIEILAAKGIDMSPHRSKHIDRELVDEASLIIVMTVSHRNQMTALFPDAEKKIFLLKSFDSAAEETDLFDPIGSSAEIYRQIYNEIDTAIPNLIDFMKNMND